ncbi:MAG: hypothetical protein K2K28_02765 [Clostridia bacterium]|nr:hypothetical protein [Clostridia bacterium]
MEIIFITRRTAKTEDSSLPEETANLPRRIITAELIIPAAKAEFCSIKSLSIIRRVRKAI